MNKNNQKIHNLNGINRILIIRLSSLGDVLLATPLIRILKNNFPGIEIGFVTKSQYADGLKLNPHINRLFLFEPQDEKIPNLIEELKKQSYDLVIDLQNNLRSKKITDSLDIKTVRFYKHSFDKFLLVNFKINRLKNTPPIPERYLLTIPGLKPDGAGLELYTKEEPSFLLKGKTNLIGIAPGSKHFTKRWPKEYFEYLGKLLIKTGYQVVLFGGKDDITICAEISERIENSINLCNNDDLLQTAADIKECLAFVCNDSGLMHAACAVKVPVLALFGSTVKEFGFIPYKNSNLILENNSLTCRPCSHIGRKRCPRGHFRCMLDLSPEKTFQVLMTLIES
jgi:heptosyltransferase-2